MRRILVVDDEPDGCEPVVLMLQRAGYEAYCVPNGRVALSTLLGGNWDAAILDVRMPDMDGINLLQIMRSYLRWHAMPVLLLTAHASEAQIEQAKRLGVRQVFHKANYELADLGRAVDEVTGGAAS
jgi:CheY-like chemotaxis protein